MAILQYVTNNSNRIAVAMGGIGLIISIVAGVTNYTPAYQVRNNTGSIVWQVNGFGDQSGSGTLLARVLASKTTPSCDTIDTTSTGMLICGSDAGAGGSFDNRYVNTFGDTMTGTLLISNGKHLQVEGTISGSTLKITGTASGNVFHGEKGLSSSGTLVWETNASGASLWAGKYDGGGLTDCDTANTSKLLWDTTTKRYFCGTDIDTQFSNTGTLQTAFDSRYVNTSGDTMTGNLLIANNKNLQVQGMISGTTLKVLGSGSGNYLHAEKGLSSSGSFVWEGSASGASFWASKIDGAGLADCDTSGNKLMWDTTSKRFSCASEFSNTGSLRGNFDNRYVNIPGDTMTGALVVQVTTSTVGGTNAALRSPLTARPTTAGAGNYYGSFPSVTYSGTGNTTGVVASNIYQTNAAANVSITNLAGGWINSLSNDGHHPTITNLFGTRLNAFDAEDATVTNAYGVLTKLAAVDNGSITNSYGVYMDDNTIGTGTVVSQVGIYIANVAGATTENTALKTNAGDVILNEGGSAAADLRVEGDSLPSLFFTDASADKVGINTSVPEQRFTVSGGIILNTAGGTVSTLSGIDLLTAVTAIDVFGDWIYLGRASSASTCSATVFDGCELLIADITSKNAPRIVYGFDYSVQVNEILASERFLYVGLNSISGPDLVIYDISKKTAPEKKGGLDLGGTVTRLSRAGKYLYIGRGLGSSSEFYIADISNPSAPFITYNTEMGSTVGAITAVGDYAYIGLFAIDPGFEFSIYKITNPAAPQLMSGVNLTVGVDEIAVSGKTAYVCMSTVTGNEIRSYDVSNPSAPVEIGGVELGVSCRRVHVAGKYLYAGVNSVSGDDFRIYNVENPIGTWPLVGGMNLGVNVQEMDMQGKYAHLGLSTISGNDYRIVDLPGADLPAAEIGSLAVRSLSVSYNMSISNNLVIGNALNVGPGGIASYGPISVFAGSGGIGLTGAIIRTRGITGTLLALDNYSTGSLATANSHLLFGARGVFDANLYRYLPNVLKTDDSLQVVGTLSGNVLHAEKTLSASGSAIITGTATARTALSGGTLTISKQSAGSGKIVLHGSQGSYICLRDTDDVGWTQVSANNGVLTANIADANTCP